MTSSRLASYSRRTAGAFCMAFTMAAVAEAPPLPANSTPVPPETPKATAKETPKETLWKTQTFESVIALRPCPSTGMCGEIRWLDPNDTKLADYFGNPATKGDNGYTVDDVKALCGFSPRMQFAEASTGHWQGTMELRGWGMTAKVDATVIDDNNLKVTFAKGIFSKTENWTRVAPTDARYPACTKPGKPTP